ncbi:MAG: DUF547 domain-containing protein [Alphaproteobacteria bacterium]|nr:DUF547 domain-containing protein [Alphaproteobacteria bacterium]
MAAPKAELWARWQAQDASSTQRIDHGAWDAFLKRHVVASPDGVNRVGYARVSGSDKAGLDAYIQSLAGAVVGKLNRGEQRALWTNLYNALTVQVVLGAYPVKSIRDIKISPGLFSSGPWGKKLVKVEGEEVSLDDIEHRILRPIWKDPRTHYAVNCASIGCPNLPRDAFTAGTMNAMLDAAARAFVNHARGAAVKDGRLTTSSIYVWFKDDFGGNDEGVIDHLKRFAAAPLAEALAGVTRIGTDQYDWALNDARGTAG